MVCSIKKIIVLFINGEMFFFEDADFNCNFIETLKDYAKNIIVEQPNLKDLNDDEVCNQFVKSVIKIFNIDLKRLVVSSVLRINK